MKKIFFFLLLIVSIVLHAQPININEHFKNWKPRNIGPSGMSGRIVAIDAVHTNPNIIYLGAASGGVWKTTNGGSEWEPIFDEQPILNIGSIAIQQSNPAVVWVGTGEGNPRNSLNIGEGIYKSLDAGKTWKKMGLEKTRNIHRVLIDPSNPNMIYAAAIGNPYSEHPERGVFKSIDGGETWSKILYVNDTTGCAARRALRRVAWRGRGGRADDRRPAPHRRRLQQRVPGARRARRRRHAGFVLLPVARRAHGPPREAR